MKKTNYIICPVCGKTKFMVYDDLGTSICPSCGWAHDTLAEENSSEIIGPNDLSLNDYKDRYSFYISKKPNYYWKVDGYPEVPQIERHICPVCGKFEFEPLSWPDLICGVTPKDVFCFECGWKFDEDQALDQDRFSIINNFTVNEYRNNYFNKIKENSNYHYIDEVTQDYIPKPHICPVCGKYTFSDYYSYEICPHCGWEDDGAENDEDYIGANKESFLKYKQQYDMKKNRS